MHRYQYTDFGDTDRFDCDLVLQNPVFANHKAKAGEYRTDPRHRSSHALLRMHSAMQATLQQPKPI